MITLKREFQAALQVLGGDVVYGYPRYYENLPLVSWRESMNRRHAQADGREHLAELEYTLEIFAPDSETADALLASADAALTGMGLRRDAAAGQYESERCISHITARYRCLADGSGNIYQ